MTFEKFFTDYLVNNGMFPRQAEEVMAIVKIEDEVMNERWADKIDGYPIQMKAVIKLTVDQTAVKWIDKNLPKAWYRQLFITDEVKD